MGLKPEVELERAQARVRRPGLEVKPVVNKVTTRMSPGPRADFIGLLPRPAGFSSLIRLITSSHLAIKPVKKTNICQAR